MKNAVISFAFAIAWLIITTVLLALPGSALPKANWLDTIWFDKWVHIGIFALLVILWAGAGQKKYADQKKKFAFFIMLGMAGLAYGIAMEFVQRYFIANRSFDPGDIVADAIGCTGGVIYSWGRYIKK